MMGNMIIYDMMNPDVACETLIETNECGEFVVYRLDNGEKVDFRVFKNAIEFAGALVDLVKDKDIIDSIEPKHISSEFNNWQDVLSVLNSRKNNLLTKNTKIRIVLLKEIGACLPIEFAHNKGVGWEYRMKEETKNTYIEIRKMFFDGGE